MYRLLLLIMTYLCLLLTYKLKGFILSVTIVSLLEAWAAVQYAVWPSLACSTLSLALPTGPCMQGSNIEGSKELLSQLFYLFIALTVSIACKHQKTTFFVKHEKLSKSPEMVFSEGNKALIKNMYLLMAMDHGNLSEFLETDERAKLYKLGQLSASTVAVEQGLCLTSSGICGSYCTQSFGITSTDVSKILAYTYH